MHSQKAPNQVKVPWLFRQTRRRITLLYAGYFYNNLTRGGAQSSSPSNRPKNQGLGINYGRTLKYRQLLDSRKKNGVDPPKIGPVPLKSKFRQKMSNMTTSKIANFDLVHENGSNSVIFGPIHLIFFAYGHWYAVLGVGWGNLERSPWFVVKFWGRSKKIQDFQIPKFATHSTLSGRHD